MPRIFSPSAWQNRCLVLLTLCVLTASYYLGLGLYMPWFLLAILPWAWRYGHMHTVHLILILLATYIAPQLFYTYPPQLVSKASGVVVYLYLALLIDPLRRSLDGMKVGRWNRTGLIFAVVVILLSAGGLIGWVHFANPNIKAYGRTLAGVSHRFLPIYMGGFAVTNALLEELLWRGVVMTALESAFGAGAFALVAQAIVFGMAHFHGGFPSGWSGASLAALFGLGMGLLRRFSNGLLVPWIAHSAADFTVISLIVRMSHRVT